VTEAELAALVDGHRDLLRFVERRVGDRAVAEDVLQEALVRALPRAGELADEGSAVAWLYRTLRNAVVDHARRRGVADRALGSLAAEPEPDGEPPPDARDAICRCVTRLADALKPEYAEALRRVDVEGTAVRDYAAQAGITSNNASVRLHRAREALRSQVRAACGTCAEHGCLDCGCRPRPAQGP
jgi:RNA polymerase sigma-70 factor (ECF subfamily)